MRRAHKWLAAVVGLQAVIWSLSGLYMCAVHIDFIHGDHLIREPALPRFAARSLTDPLAAVALVPGGTSARLATLQRRPVWIVEAGDGKVLVDAATGQRRRLPTEQQIRDIAVGLFAGEERLARLQLIDAVPGELRGRKPPLWRADFDGWNKPTLYLSPDTGELVSRRHELWRAFDFLWMLHIMDYDERENVNNSLLRLFTMGAVLTTLTGASLLFFALPIRRRKARS